MALDRDMATLGKFRWRPWGLAVGISLTGALFVLAWAFPTFPGDEWALVKLQGTQTQWLTWMAKAVSFLGWTPLAVGLAAVTIAGLLAVKRRPDALMVLLGAVVVIMGNALKLAVDRPRPTDYLMAQVPSLPSFPSGHAVYAIILGGILIFLVGDLVRNPLVRRGLQSGLVLLVLAIGASRVYLGFHWPSDVIGGYLFGGVALLELIWLRNRLKT